jgi:hypothetical protein
MKANNAKGGGQSVVFSRGCTGKGQRGLGFGGFGKSYSENGF